MTAEIRPKRIKFDYPPSISKEAMDNDFDFFDSHLDSSSVSGNSVAVRCIATGPSDCIAAAEFVEV